MRKFIVPVAVLALGAVVTLLGGEAASASEAGRFVIGGGRF